MAAQTTDIQVPYFFVRLWRRGRWTRLRGGSWNNNPVNCRSACRNNYNGRDNRNNNIGFRVLCVVGRSLCSQICQVRICRACTWRVQSIPAMLVTVSKNELGWEGLVSEQLNSSFTPYYFNSWKVWLSPIPYTGKSAFQIWTARWARCLCRVARVFGFHSSAKTFCVSL